MSVDFIIVGQGICGTFLHWYLSEAGFSCMVIDEDRENTATKTAAGIINPVTGRRIVQTWMIEQLIEFSKRAYGSLGSCLGINLITETTIVDFFPTVQMRMAFLERIEEKAEYLTIGKNDHQYDDWFHAELGFGVIAPAFLVQLNKLLPAYRAFLKLRGELIESNFNNSLAEYRSSKILYENIEAQKIFFCDGIDSAKSPFFRLLPFAPNKGEMLTISCKGIPANCIFKKGLNLVPVEKDIFWVGSSYEWSFENDQPTSSFLKYATDILKKWLKVPFDILDHRASIRPATLERRPFAGFHPINSRIGILNGMGTKGCTLAPYFASQIAENCISQKPILPEADISRFANTLRRNVIE
ncbi:MAG TPA: FAD-dependent oxidoreductase [Flavitalea sp.]|nr:FAD-dependent oxidoreductase [Flavitalea sp.]